MNKLRNRVKYSVTASWIFKFCEFSYLLYYFLIRLSQLNVSTVKRKKNHVINEETYSEIIRYHSSFLNLTIQFPESGAFYWSCNLLKGEVSSIEPEFDSDVEFRSVIIVTNKSRFQYYRRPREQNTIKLVAVHHFELRYIVLVEPLNNSNHVFLQRLFVCILSYYDQKNWYPP